MRKLLVQLDGDRLPSAFDRIVAYDAGAEEVLSYGAVAEADVQGLVHGAIFTRGPKDLKNTALFVGGSSMPVAERLLEAARQAFFGPFRVSVMLDPNGSNTTAAAAVVLQPLGSSMTETRKGPKKALLAASSRLSASGMREPPTKRAVFFRSFGPRVKTAPWTSPWTSASATAP